MNMAWKAAHPMLKLAGILLLAGLLSGCDGEGLVIQLDNNRSIAIVPKHTQTNEVIVLEATLTPFLPVADDAGEGVFTAIAAQQLSTSTQTPLVEISSTAAVTLVTATPTATGEASATPLTATPLPSGTLTHTVTPSITASGLASATAGSHTPTATRTLTKTATPTGANTATRTATKAASTSTFTFTPVPKTATYTKTPTKTFTFTVNAPVNTNTPTNTSQPSSCQYTENSGFESTLVSLINEGRASQNLPALSVNSLLTAAARGHSQDMACQDYFSHTGLDGSTAATRVLAAGYSYSWVGENIFGGSGSYNSPEQAYLYWATSQAHYDNMMNSNFSEIGIGYVYCADSTYGGYFTANFASP